MDEIEIMKKEPSINDLLNYNVQAVKLIQYKNFTLSLQILKGILKQIEKFPPNKNNEEFKILQSITYNNFACLYKKTGKPNVSLNYLFMALKISLSSENVSHMDVISTLINICVTYSVLGKHKISILYGLKGLQAMINKMENEPFKNYKNFKNFTNFKIDINIPITEICKNGKQFMDQFIDLINLSENNLKEIELNHISKLIYNIGVEFEHLNCLNISTYFFEKGKNLVEFKLKNPELLKKLNLSYKSVLSKTNNNHLFRKFRKEWRIKNSLTFIFQKGRPSINVSNLLPFHKSTHFNNYAKVIPNSNRDKSHKTSISSRTYFEKKLPSKFSHHRLNENSRAIIDMNFKDSNKKEINQFFEKLATFQESSIKKRKDLINRGTLDADFYNLQKNKIRKPMTSDGGFRRNKKTLNTSNVKEKLIDIYKSPSSNKDTISHSSRVQTSYDQRTERSIRRVNPNFPNVEDYLKNISFKIKNLEKTLNNFDTSFLKTNYNKLINPNIPNREENITPKIEEYKGNLQDTIVPTIV